MNSLLLKKENLERYMREFNNINESSFSFNYEWTEKWADKKLHDNKSFKEHLIWEDHSLWYFYEYFIRDTYGYEGMPFLPFSGAMFKIDFYKWIIEKEKPKEIIIDEIGIMDFDIIKSIAIKKNITIKCIKKIPEKKKIADNSFLVRNYIKSRIILRYLISKTHKSNSNHEDIIIISNDRHSASKKEDDSFFGSIIKEFEKDSIHYKLIEYDRPYSNDSIKRSISKFFLKNNDYRFIGDYYSIKTIVSIFSKGRKFKRLGNEIISSEEFKRSLEYKGVNMYPFVKNRLKFIFNVLSYYIADIMIITKRILEQENPRMVLLEHEKNFYDKGIIVNANKINNNKRRRISTVCFEGEMLYDKNTYLKSSMTKEMNNPKSHLWRPLPTSKLVWGEYSKKWLVRNANYPKKIIKIIGAPKYDTIINNMKNMNREALFQKYGLKNKKTVLIITGTVPWEEKLLHDSIKSLNGMKVQVIIKLHPDDSQKVYSIIEKYCGKYKVKTDLIIKYCNFSELVIMSDLVLTYESTLVYEILIANKPVFVFGSFENEYFMEYSKKKAVNLIRNPETLKDNVKNALNNRDYSERLEKSMRFLKDYLYKTDGKSSKRAVEEIKKMIGNN